MNIVDHFKEIVQDMGTSHFMWGTRMEVNKRLMNKKNRYDKYPLIVLYAPITGDQGDGMVNYSLNLTILEYTKSSINAEQRMTNVFVPTLMPLYKQFMQSIRNVGPFSWEGDMERPPHSQTLVPYWGVETSEGMIKKYYSDPLDAIAITNLRVSMVPECDDDLIIPEIPGPDPSTQPKEWDSIHYLSGEWKIVSIEDLAVKLADTPI